MAYGSVATLSTVETRTGGNEPAVPSSRQHNRLHGYGQLVGVSSVPLIGPERSNASGRVHLNIHRSCTNSAQLRPCFLPLSTFRSLRVQSLRQPTSMPGSRVGSNVTPERRGESRRLHVPPGRVVQGPTGCQGRARSSSSCEVTCFSLLLHSSAQKHQSCLFDSTHCQCKGQEVQEQVCGLGSFSPHGHGRDMVLDQGQFVSSLPEWQRACSSLISSGTSVDRISSWL